MKRRKILFAHCAEEQSGKGQGSYDLVSNLRKALENEYEIHYPIIESPESPTYKNWKKLLMKEFTSIIEPLILIGHSLGGSVLHKYLSELKPNVSISSLFLVATPHWGKEGWNMEEFELLERFELALPPIGKVFLYHSKGDTIVPLKHLDFYQKAFPNATVRILDGEDHIFADGIPKLVNDIKTAEWN